jgi:predicted RNase H-like HicB family nuclease
MDKYSFNVFWYEPDSAYFAVSPEFPGLSASGDTPAEAVAEAQIALQLLIDLHNEEGWALPAAQTQRTVGREVRVQIPEALHNELVAQAEAEGLTLHAFVEQHLSEAVGPARKMTAFSSVPA